MFLSGTVLNVVAVLVGTTIGLLLGSRMPARLQSTLTDGLGLFTLLLGLALALRYMLVPGRPVAEDLALLGGLLGGAVIGELLRISDRLDALGAWFQRRLARPDRPSRISEGFITASLVFCVGPLTILGPLQNGLTGEIELLAVKSLLDGVAAIAFAAALGAGVYLSAVTVLIVQGALAAVAALAGAGIEQALIDIASAVGGLLLMGVSLRLLELRQVRVANFLPALVLAPALLVILRAVAP
jgi:uncharacterized membrane protein YqgA involved in biofilm formation